MAVLLICHSNAREERILSIARKNKTEFRSCLELGRSLNSILIVKSAIPESRVTCNEWKPTQDLLKNVNQQQQFIMNNIKAAYRLYSIFFSFVSFKLC